MTDPPEDLHQARRKGPKPNGSPIDRLPPNSIEAEQGVLGCLLLDPEACVPVVIDKIGTSAAFYDLRHRTIYEVIVSAYDQRVPIDMLTVTQKLRDLGQLEAVGGLVYVASLPDMVPSAAHVDYYAVMLQEKATMRRLVHVSTATVTAVYEDGAVSEDVLDMAEREILRIRHDIVKTEQFTTPQLVDRALVSIDTCTQQQGMLTGLSTGFPDLDKMTSGLQPGDMVVIAGRPSMGKTSFCLNIAEHVAVGGNIPVGVFSLEMTADALMMRLICSRARVNHRNVRDGFLADRDGPRLIHAAGQIRKAPLYIDETSGLSSMALRARARRMHQQHGIKLFVVDYLQLMQSTNKKAESRQQEIADISNGLKSLGKELRVPILIAAQLNREVEREKRKPRLSDLRESGAIEQDSDFVGLLYRSSGEDGDEDGSYSQECIPMNLLIAKQRNGPTGEVFLSFLKSYTRFESASKVSAVDVEDRRQSALPYPEG